MTVSGAVPYTCMFLTAAGRSLGMIIPVHEFCLCFTEGWSLADVSTCSSAQNHSVFGLCARIQQIVVPVTLHRIYLFLTASSSLAIMKLVNQPG